mmetsp:Transcript_100679/g.204131  ORF Transcript_100679/g.204131 Transcript_100679/m.204131 type:complete len:530 (-) Transcript_100679:225-1814(-)|eukprot:CAMPEP_0201133220 /NCGR_PEP_ID=MMETSP0850-20130426/48133_1 /ASSEMBLY_ACC=CAM_ASM_000622 /TAXON_ID=183588 /ORGANISM="Pseudo-nitzschia fraudulenta, Strain WWA7" /LENGTH=529 /DNA_ID=CAMNT_0047403791 /DNA_START=21 /DNA_END=1610 /DNA_ORIENTATION=+
MKFSVLALTAALASNHYAASFSSPSRFSAVRKQQPQQQQQPLFGILDEVMGDDYNLMGSEVVGDGAGGESDELAAAYEIFLGDLVFSTNDPRLDIVENYEQATDPKFLNWMEKKSDNSTDPDERLALKDLLGMIKDVQRKQELSKLQQEREEKEAAAAEEQRIIDAEVIADEGRQMSNADLLRKAQEIDSASAATAEDRAETAKKSFYEEEITPEILMSYEDTLKDLLPPYKTGTTPASVVMTNYDRFDAQFVKVLNAKVAEGDEGSAALLQALAEEQSKRIEKATEQLKAVLSMGDPMRMEGLIVKMVREDQVDESFLLLLEANETQARDAGAMGPAELMKRLRLRAAEEKDKQASSKEIALIRKLLRAEDSAEREKILEDAFTPRENLLVAGTPENAAKAMDGETPEQEKPMPDVPPPDFINACKAVMLNFGNLSYDDERGDLSSRIKQIASEAEVVATRIYGQGMSLREQQDRAWKEQTTSIFDLEQMELEAEANGESAPWANPNDDGDMLLPGFDAQGKMKIGGS